MNRNMITSILPFAVPDLVEYTAMIVMAMGLLVGIVVSEKIK